MAKAGTVTLELDANSVKLIRELQRAQNQTRRSGRSMQKTMRETFTSMRREATRSAKYIAGIATAMAATGAAIFRTQGQMLDELAKTSDALGIQQERLQALQLVADLTGTSANQLSTNLERMQRNIGRVAREGGPAQRALDDIGVSINDIINLRPDEQLEVLSDALAGVENQAIKASIAQDLFGRDGVRMLKLMEQLKDQGLTPVVEELEAMGIAFTRLDTARVERANDELQKAREAAQATARQFTVGISTAVATLSNMFVESRKGAESIADSVEQIMFRAIIGSIRLSAQAGAFLDPIKTSLGTLWDSFRSLPPWVQELGIIGAVVFGRKGRAALAGLAVGTAAINKANDAMKDFFGIVDRPPSRFEGPADMVDSVAQGPSLLRALFGSDSQDKTDWDEWAERNIENFERTYERIRSEVEAGVSTPASPTELIFGDDDAGADISSALNSIVRSTQTQVERVNQQIALVEQAIKEGITEPFTQAGTTGEEVLSRLHENLRELTQDEETVGFWDRWLESAQESLTNIDELVSNTIQNFASGFGQAFERMVFDAENATDAIRGMMEGIARSLVRALGEMAAQWLAYQAVQLAVGRTTRTAAGTTIAAQAQAMSQMAGLNAFASTAAIPIVGPAAAPGAMAAALGVTQPIAASINTLALTGMAHDGIDSVPYEGTWLLDKGERVMTSQTSAKLDATLERLNNALSGGSMGANVSFTIPNTDESIRRVLIDSEDIIVNAMSRYMRSMGREL